MIKAFDNISKRVAEDGPFMTTFGWSGPVEEAIEKLKFVLDLTLVRLNAGEADVLEYVDFGETMFKTSENGVTVCRVQLIRDNKLVVKMV